MIVKLKFVLAEIKTLIVATILFTPVVHQPKPSYPPGYAVGTDKTHLPASHPGFVPNPRGPHPPHPGFRGPHPGMYSQGQPMRPQDIPPRFEER